METSNFIEHWHELYIMLGTTAGALVGLLFIVMSLHLDKIREQVDDNFRFTIEGARNNTYHLLTILIETALVLMPQPLYLLGTELFVINVYGLRLPLSITFKYYRMNVKKGERRSFPIVTIVTISLGYLLGMSGGFALIRHWEWGMYLLSISLLMLLVRSVLTAWMFMFIKKTHQ